MSDQHEHGEDQARDAQGDGEQRDQQEHPAQAEVREDAREAADEHEQGGDVDVFDDSDAGPEQAVDESLRNALAQMRDESQRISELDTGDEQVQAAEQFVDAAGKLDERIGAHARAEDERGR